MFRIPKTLTDTLFSKYAVVDKVNSTPLEAWKAQLNTRLEEIEKKLARGENIGIVDGMIRKARRNPEHEIKSPLIESDTE